MRRSLRSIALPAAIAAAGAAALVPAQAALGGDIASAPQVSKPAPAGGGYFGVWVLKSWTFDGRELACPVVVPQYPGAPSLSCGPNTYLKLFRDSRYTTDLPVFSRHAADRGVFVVIAYGGKAGNAIVFDDAGALDEPRAYRMSLVKTRGKKAPTGMKISTSMSAPGGTQMQVAMNFVRYTG
jgi:hypothetical protein